MLIIPMAKYFCKYIQKYEMSNIIGHIQKLRDAKLLNINIL